MTSAEKTLFELPEAKSFGTESFEIPANADKTAITQENNEVVNNPDHYCSRVSDKKMKYIIKRIVDRGYIEVIDIIDAWNLDFQLGNAIKYELRLGKKMMQ